jgi:hypothetical protein
LLSQSIHQLLNLRVCVYLSCAAREDFCVAFKRIRWYSWQRDMLPFGFSFFTFPP